MLRALMENLQARVSPGHTSRWADLDESFPRPPTESLIQSTARREASNKALTAVTDPPLFWRLNFFTDFGNNFGDDDCNISLRFLPTLGQRPHSVSLADIARVRFIGWASLYESQNFQSTQNLILTVQ